jgi:hypothetical protein
MANFPKPFESGSRVMNGTNERECGTILHIKKTDGADRLEIQWDTGEISWESAGHIYHARPSRIQQNLAEAKIALLDAQSWLFHARKETIIGNRVFEDAAVRRRHAAADRVFELQCMANGVFG